MLNGEPIGYAQSYVALGSGDGWWEEETDPGVRGIDRSLANASQLGKGLGTKLVRALVELLFNDPESPRSKRTRRRATGERSDATRAGFEAYAVTPDGPAVYMVQTRQAFEQHVVMPNPSIEGDVQLAAPLAALMSNVRPL